jgi:hypothetical protein
MGEYKLRETNRKELLNLVQRAFEGIELGNGISLRETDVIDNYGGEKARKAAKLQDERRNWTAIPYEDIARYHWAYSWLDAEGFRYYLPAVMSWAIEESSKWDFDDSSLSSVLYCLTPHQRRRTTVRDDHFHALISLLSPPQRQAVQQFLWWLVSEFSDEEAFEALDLYWKNEPVAPVA